jgi:thiol-disulfide isomerase/thioredoxin
MSKNKLAAIIVACTIVVIIAIVLISVKPWERTYILSTSINPPQGGFVASSHGQYEYGTEVTLIAYPASGYKFDHWSGSVSGNTSTITITMDSDKSLTANFETITKAKHNLTISINGQGTTNPGVGIYEYDSGTQVTITASPAFGWRFDNWTGDASVITDVNAASTTITVNDSYSVTANFQEVDVVPDFTLPTMTGANITLSELEGTPVVLNFWSISCYWCRKQLPYLENVAQQSVGEIEVVVVNIVDNAVSIEDFFAEYEPTMIVALDREGETFRDYCLEYDNPRGYIPFTLFVDSEGIMRYKQTGAFPTETALWDTLHDVFET